jgi:anti-anti-sigma regulatory factor
MIEEAKVNLRKDADGIHAYVSVPGAIVAATAHSMKEALHELAEILSDDEEPFWLEREATHAD